jgi:hypothetical protein
VSTMTEEGVSTDLLETMFDEPPVLCEITYGGEQCGKPASWSLQGQCTGCGHVSQFVFVCQECHDQIVKPHLYIGCNMCPGHRPMNQNWKPL